MNRSPLVELHLQDDTSFDSLTEGITDINCCLEKAEQTIDASIPACDYSAGGSRPYRMMYQNCTCDSLPLGSFSAPLPEKKEELIIRPKTLVKAVEFDTVEIHYHAYELGDNPSVTEGAPLTISWVRENTKMYDVQQYESLRPSEQRRQRDELRLSSFERIKRLWLSGYSIQEIVQCAVETNNQRRERKNRLKQKRWDRLHIAMESTKKGLTKAARKGIRIAIAPIRIPVERIRRSRRRSTLAHVTYTAVENEDSTDVHPKKQENIPLSESLPTEVSESSATEGGQAVCIENLQPSSPRSPRRIGSLFRSEERNASTPPLPPASPRASRRGSLSSAVVSAKAQRRSSFHRSHSEQAFSRKRSLTPATPDQPTRKSSIFGHHQKQVVNRRASLGSGVADVATQATINRMGSLQTTPLPREHARTKKHGNTIDDSLRLTAHSPNPLARYFSDTDDDEEEHDSCSNHARLDSHGDPYRHHPPVQRLNAAGLFDLEHKPQ